MFIVITGLDGSGTSTVAKLLHEMDENSDLIKTPNEKCFSREKIDDSVREVSQMSHYLYYLSSVVYESDKIKKEGKYKKNNVYCVRYLIDTVVSHSAAGLDVKLDYETYDILKPDVTIFVKVDETIRQERITERGKSTLDKVLDDSQRREQFNRQFKYFLGLESGTIIEFDNGNSDVQTSVKELFKSIQAIGKKHE